MKKYIILLLALCMLFCVACTEKESEQSGSVSDTKAEATDKVTESKPSDTEPSDTKSEETEKPKDDEIEIPASNHLQFDTNKEGTYNYCPAIMQVDEKTRYIYYCTNQKSYNVTDYIGCRKGTLGESGVWSWSEESIVLSPTENTWDARHVCDPSVIAGEFKYEGRDYSYLMAYLGCTSNNSQDNKLGFAVAQSPEGPFVKVGSTPFIDFVRDNTVEVFQWGVGQASLINMDKKSSVMLFYTRGDKDGTRTMAEEWDFSDLSAPVCKMQAVKLSEVGLRNLKGEGDIINNADFVYDSATDRFYATSDCHPNPTSVPDYISSHFRITYFKRPLQYDVFTWKSLAQVGTSQTGFSRNHNTGILRDSYGHLANGYITVYYTVSEEGNNSLWSYRIYDYHTKLAK